MDIKNFLSYRVLKIAVLVLVILIVLVLVFSLGVSVGAKKADFSFKWAQEYHNNFGGPKGGVFGNMPGGEFTESNGVFGKILKIDGQTLTINGRDNIEKTVIVDDKTIITYQKKNIILSDVTVDSDVVVIGIPNDKGQIEAKLIRVLPEIKNIQPSSSLMIPPPVDRLPADI